MPHINFDGVPCKMYIFDLVDFYSDNGFYLALYCKVFMTTKRTPQRLLYEGNANKLIESNFPRAFYS